MTTFLPTSDQIRAAETLFAAMAQEAVVREIVEPYETAILAKHQFPIAKRWIERGLPDKIILNRKDVFLLEDKDRKTFFDETFISRDAAGLKVTHPENDPLLEIQNLRLQAEDAFLASMAENPLLNNLKIASLSLSNREKIIQLSLSLLARFCGSGPEILGRLGIQSPQDSPNN